MRNRGGANVPCPVCKQIGRYYKYKKPIYSWYCNLLEYEQIK